MVSAWYVGGIRGSGIVSSAADMLWMSVVHGMRGVGEVCEMCMCLAQGGVCGEGVSGGEDWIGFGLYQSCENMGSVGRVSVFGLRWEVGVGLGPGSGGVVLYLCEIWVWIICVDSSSRYLLMCLDTSAS